MLSRDQRSPGSRRGSRKASRLRKSASHLQSLSCAYRGRVSTRCARIANLSMRHQGAQDRNSGTAGPLIRVERHPRETQRSPSLPHGLLLCRQLRPRPAGANLQSSEKGSARSRCPDPSPLRRRFFVATIPHGCQSQRLRQRHLARVLRGKAEKMAGPNSTMPANSPSSAPTAYYPNTGKRPAGSPGDEKTSKSASTPAIRTTPACTELLRLFASLLLALAPTRRSPSS